MGVVGKRGIVSEMNVVPLIDILLVLLVIFMMMPHKQKGPDAVIPQQASSPVPYDPPGIIVVGVASDGSVQINQSAVRPEGSGARPQEIFARRPDRVAFSPGRSFSRISSGCPGSGSHAYGGRHTHRPAEFGTGKKSLNVMEWPLHRF